MRRHSWSFKALTVRSLRGRRLMLAAFVAGIAALPTVAGIARSSALFTARQSSKLTPAQMSKPWFVVTIFRTPASPIRTVSQFVAMSGMTGYSSKEAARKAAEAVADGQEWGLVQARDATEAAVRASGLSPDIIDHRPQPNK